MLEVGKYMDKLTEACEHYEKTAPTVASHCDDLYMRMEECPQRVSLAELLGVQNLWKDGTWQQPNYAANQVYHLRHRLGMDVTGQAGY